VPKQIPCQFEILGDPDLTLLTQASPTPNP